MLFKNVASQKIHVYAYDSTTGAPKTGDAANITGYVSLDGTANAIDDTNPAEVDSTNMPGLYVFDLTQAETNCDAFALVAKSSTANIRIEPIIGFTTGSAVTQTGDAYARLGAPAGASVSADVAAIKSDSAAILEDTGTTLDTLIKDIPTVAEFEARTIAAADYLVASDTLARVTLVDTCTTNTDMRGTDSASTHSAADVKTALEADGSKLDHLWEMTEDDGGVRRLTTNALEQAPAGGTGLDAAGVRAAIGLSSANLDTQLAALPTAAENADATWDEALAGHAGVGSAGAGLAAAGSAGDPWSTPLPGAYGAGTAGNIIGTLSTPGSGSAPRVYSLTESTSGNPIVGATVTVTTDIAGTVVVASGTTDSGGKVEFYLDAGTYYLWRSCTGYTFVDPDTEVFV